MTEKEALDIIENKKLKPINSGSSFHVYEEQYEINGYVIKLLWAIYGSDKPDVEILNIDEQFQQDYKVTKSGYAFMRSLPDKIYKRELKKRKLTDKSEPKMNIELLNKKLEKFLETVSVEELKSSFEQLGYKFEKIKSKDMKNKKNIAKR